MPLDLLFVDAALLNLSAFRFRHLHGALQIRGCACGQLGLDSGRGLSLPGADLRFDKGWVRPCKTVLPGFRLELSAPGRHPLPSPDAGPRTPRTALQMSVLLDTDLISLLERKRVPARLTDWLEEIEAPILVSVVSLAE
ncbi:MAG: type II toxin-antitoxin system VapC family toxin, partial [Chlorobiaceae bacterium]|nr:type II toxin-antitoxin system VapC family toxin [Chlorobiaceae bacterium]